MKRIFLVPFLLVVFLSALAQDQQIPSLDGGEILGTSINTDFQEVKPLISPDGKTLYFSRRNCPQNVLGEKDAQDIWVSRMKEDGEWDTATNLGNIVNDKYANAICAISSDGKMGIFYNTYGKLEHPLAKATIVNNQWTKPQPILIEDYYNMNEYSDFYTCFESNVLFMAIEREDSYGGQDLYVSLVGEDGNYQKPINLGSQINTEHADFAPFLAADGRTLFFASYGHNGLGGSDIYMTQRVDETWTKWSTPVNLGSTINTQHNETYFSVTGDFRFLYLDTFSPVDERRNIARLMMPDGMRPRQFQEATIAPKISYAHPHSLTFP